MRALLAAALLLSLAFAGCTDGGNDDDPTPTSSSSSSSSASRSTSATSSSASSSSSGTGTAAPAANRAPTGSIAATANGTLVLFNLTGSDQDNDALSWTLSFGDGNQTSGTTLPAALNHTFTAGNYTAVYNLTDGQLTASYNVSFAVTDVAGAVSQVVTGEWPAGAFNCALRRTAYDDGSSEDSLQGIQYYTFLVDPATYGKPFAVTLTPTAPPLYWTFELTDGSGTAQFEGPFPVPPATGPLSFGGTVPAGVVFGFAASCGGAGLSLSYRAG